MIYRYGEDTNAAKFQIERWMEGEREGGEGGGGEGGKEEEGRDSKKGEILMISRGEEQAAVYKAGDWRNVCASEWTARWRGVRREKQVQNIGGVVRESEY